MKKSLFNVVLKHNQKVATESDKELVKSLLKDLYDVMDLIDEAIAKTERHSRKNSQTA